MAAVSRGWLLPRLANVDLGGFGNEAKPGWGQSRAILSRNLVYTRILLHSLVVALLPDFFTVETQARHQARWLSSGGLLRPSFA